MSRGKVEAPTTIADAAELAHAILRSIERASSLLTTIAAARGADEDVTTEDMDLAIAGVAELLQGVADRTGVLFEGLEKIQLPAKGGAK